MGKKNRRPNRNKPKDISTAGVAAPRQVIPTTTDNVSTSNQLYESEDWEGLLELESEMSAIASNDPGAAIVINFILGDAHKELGREGGIKRATLYFKKTIELAKKAGNNYILTKALLCLCGCYVKNGRIEEAMDLYKSRCDEIGKESMDPGDILTFAQIVNNDESSRSLTILEEYLETIERSWNKHEQYRAYHMIAGLYRGKDHFAKSNMYFERQLSIAKETKLVELEYLALHGLGHNYGRMGDYDNAMVCLEQALVIQSERGDDRIGMTYTAMGDVLVAQEGREKEAILMFQKSVGLFEEGNVSEALIRLFLKLGNAYRSIGAWDDAIASLEKGLSIADSIEDASLGSRLNAIAKKSLGNVYLEKFHSTDESLVDIPERNEELIRKALFWSEAARKQSRFEGARDPTCALDLAQEYYFLGDSEKAHDALEIYLAGMVHMGESCCQACNEICAKDTIMKKCSFCKVARYCSVAHSIQGWRKGRLCHKVMCPYLQRWRKIKPGKRKTIELRDALCNDFFERVLASKLK